MIGKVMHNGSFRATTRYVLEKEQAQLIDATMGGLSAETLTAEFMASKDLHPQLKHPVWHLTLSLPHHENLSDEQFAEVGRKYMAGMIMAASDPQILEASSYPEQREAFLYDELPAYQFFQARHRDREHEHLHIVASRIHLDSGKAVELWRDAFRSQKVIRGLEAEYGLTPVQNSWEIGKKAATKGQLEQQLVTGEEAVQSRLQRIIEAAAIGQPEMPELFERLLRQGVEVRHGWTRTGKSKGISYGLDEVAFAGNQLGQRYSFPGLQKHLGVSYDAARDDERLRSLMEFGVPVEPEVDIQQQQLADELARSAIRILNQVGRRDQWGRLGYAHSQGNYRLIYDPEDERLTIESRQQGLILEGQSGQVDLTRCQVTEEDLQRFQQFERVIERSKQQRERQAGRDRGFER
ncbi:MAG: relaxase/mobilization nuclease domain-containing protein [Coleofasciculaceae cyanobacterium RL_1_1]|nr:relaxase/mobilization nuclease domain-containing protein [Coleofasciculaceae cyanobacterium RL_1_1]